MYVRRSHWGHQVLLLRRPSWYPVQPPWCCSHYFTSFNGILSSVQPSATNGISLPSDPSSFFSRLVSHRSLHFTQYVIPMLDHLKYDISSYSPSPLFCAPFFLSGINTSPLSTVMQLTVTHPVGFSSNITMPPPRESLSSLSLCWLSPCPPILCVSLP